ncbi:unnamed protein product, partial [Urochloa humidicola]
PDAIFLSHAPRKKTRAPVAPCFRRRFRFRNPFDSPPRKKPGARDSWEPDTANDTSHSNRHLAIHRSQLFPTPPPSPARSRARQAPQGKWKSPCLPNRSMPLFHLGLGAIASRWVWAEAAHAGAGGVKMNSSNTQSEGSAPSVPKNPAMASCRKKKNDDDATFLEDLKDHIDEFIHASMDEHKTCFKKTIQKMFGMSKAVAERSAAEAKDSEVESALPLQTSVSQ